MTNQRLEEGWQAGKGGREADGITELIDESGAWDGFGEMDECGTE